MFAGATVGIGAGQMSRLDSSRIAGLKMKDMNLVPPAGAHMVVASDAFFPFPDGMLAAADERGLAMIFTGIRHFRH